MKHRFVLKGRLYAFLLICKGMMLHGFCERRLERAKATVAPFREVAGQLGEDSWQLGLEKFLVEVVQALDAFPAQAQTGLGQAQNSQVSESQPSRTEVENSVWMREDGWQLDLEKLLIAVMQALDAFPAQHRNLSIELSVQASPA
jgi:hypothetical protein